MQCNCYHTYACLRNVLLEFINHNKSSYLVKQSSEKFHCSKHNYKYKHNKDNKILAMLSLSLWMQGITMLNKPLQLKIPS